MRTGGSADSVPRRLADSDARFDSMFESPLLGSYGSEITRAMPIVCGAALCRVQLLEEMTTERMNRRQSGGDGRRDTEQTDRRTAVSGGSGRRRTA